MTAIPIVTIVGVPNTGKSTLYNRLLGQRKSLIHSHPGMTRDIIRGRAESDGRAFFIQDSGGFFPNSDELSQEINKRILREVQRSDLVLFLFDGRREMLDYEKEFYLRVKRLNGQVMAVINKADQIDTFIVPNSYYALKADFVPISAEHLHGLDDLLERIKAAIKMPLVESISPESAPRITIVGKPNVGKSSIVNRLLNDEWVIVSPKPGTTRDSIDLEIRRNQQTFILIDNAGIRKLQKVKESTESAAVIRAEKFMRHADIVVFVIDLSRPIDQNDFLIAKKIEQAAKPVIIVGNKWDLVEAKADVRNLAAAIRSTFHQLYFAPFISVSAQTGKNILAIIDRSELIFKKMETRIKPRLLNEAVQSILTRKRFITVTQRAFRPKFVSIESHKPLFIKFHGHGLGRLRDNDEISLKKALSQELKLEGIPVYFKMVTP